MTAEGSVVVVDDDAAARKSLQFLLAMAGFKVSSHESGPAFLQSRDLQSCRCLIADVRMPEMTGLELLQRVKQERPDLSVIIITGHGDVPLAVEAMKSGAADFIEKPFDNDRLLDAVKGALSRDSDRDIREQGRAEIVERFNTLSPREQEVMLSLVRGNPNKVVAYELGISVRTVEIHRAHVMTKMQAGSLANLVRMALVGGYLEDPHAQT